MSNIVLVDGKNFCFRAHYTHQILSSKGRPTSVIYGATDMLLTLGAILKKKLGEVPAIAFVWDGGGETWRHRESKGTYKANRTHNPEAKLIIDQLEEFNRLLDTLGFANYIVPGLEGDDLIGMLALAGQTVCGPDGKVIIVSTDWDYSQLVGRNCVLLRDKDFVGREEVIAEFGLPPKDFIKYRALVGDKGDNIIKAQRGIGPVAALRLLNLKLDPSQDLFGRHSKYTQIECNFLRNVWPQVHLNYKLSRIVTDPRDSVLADDTKDNLADMHVFQKPTVESFTRLPMGKTAKAEDAALAFCADYEMLEIIGRRHDLFRIP